MQIFRSSDLAGDDEMKVKLGDISVLINGDRGKIILHKEILYLMVIYHL